MSRTKGDSTLLKDPAVDALGLPVRVLVTQGTDADCTQAGRLIDGLSADPLLADKGYDTDAILAQAAALGRVAVIPPKKNRVVQRAYDEALYKLRHRVENAFLQPQTLARHCYTIR